MAATVAQVARGRLIVGLGMGDAGNRAENEAFGLAYHQDPVRRAAELVRSAAALRAWGSGGLKSEAPTGAPGRDAKPSVSPPVDWGSGASLLSPPVDRGRGDGAEIWVGGTGHRARGLAARDADAWNGWGLTPEELAAALLEVGRAAEEAGRDPAEVAGTWGGQILVAESAAEARALLARWGSGRPAEEVGRVVAGDPAAVLGRLAELGEAGATWCVLAPVGGPGAPMRALLAEAADLAPRVMRPEVADR